MLIQILLTFTVILAGPVLGYMAIRRAKALRKRMDSAEQRLNTLEQRDGEPERARIAAQDGNASVEQASERQAIPTSEGETIAETGTELREEHRAREEAPANTAKSEANQEPEALPTKETPGDEKPRGGRPQPKPIASATDTTRGLESIEQALAGRWMVWLGAISVALAGIFLIKYSIEREWLGPGVRCTLGGFAGAALCGAGEWCRRAAPAGRVPPNTGAALASAGIATLYASAYAAFALYDLIPAPIAFAAMAGVSVLAFALAVLLGPLIAALGVLGGYLTPALASTGTGSALALFGFLGALALGAGAIVRYRRWDTIAVLNLGGAGIWPAVWMAGPWTWPDTPIIGVYLVGLAALAIYGRPGTEAGDRKQSDIDDGVVLGGASGCAALVFALGVTDAHGLFSFITLGALCALLIREAARTPRHLALAAISAVTVLGTFASWQVPEFVGDQGQALGEHGWLYDLGAGPWVPPHLVSYTTWAALFATAFAVTGFVIQRKGTNRWQWAAGSAGGPSALFALVYWHLAGRGVDAAWAGSALVLALLGARAAYDVIKDRTRAGSEDTFLVYTIATVIMSSAAMTLALDDEWLGIALALQVPALALLHDRIPIRGLRYLCWAVSTVVTTRLVFDAGAIAYSPGQIPGFGWALYGYGVPCVAFWYAARRFQKHEDSALVRSLEAGALAFAVSIVTLQIRYWMAGDIEGPAYPFTERSLQSIAWLTMAYVLYTRSRKHTTIITTWGWRILGAVAIGHIVLLQTLDGPLFRPIPIGEYPIANLMFLAYVVPAALGALFAVSAQRRHTPEAARVAKIAWSAVLALGFIETTLEVRHAFQGPIIAWNAGETSHGEWYAYSIAWLGYAGAVLAVAISKGSSTLRYVSLGLVMLTTAKLFLFDMSALEGLLRVLSFLGLGLSLIGIAYLYQRYVFPSATSSPVQDLPGNKGEELGEEARGSMRSIRETSQWKQRSRSQRWSP